MAIAEKEKVVAELLRNLQGSEGFVLANYQGLKAQDFNDLRAKLTGKKGNCRVVKNTLLKKALEAAKVPGLESFLDGPTAVIFQQGDVAGSSKILVDFSKDHEQLKIKAGCIKGQLLAAKDVIEIARLPSRQVLIAQVASRFNAPLQKLVNVLMGNLQSFVFALQAVRAKKESAPSGS